MTLNDEISWTRMVTIEGDLFVPRDEYDSVERTIVLVYRSDEPGRCRLFCWPYTDQAGY